MLYKLVCALIVTLTFTTGLSAQAPAPVSRLVETYCAGCHVGQVDVSRGRLTLLDPAQIAGNPELWSRAARHLRAGTMPPAGAPRPDRRAIDEAIAAIELELE